MSSANIVNFSIRPNKAVQRKVVFEVLRVLSPAITWQEYRYIGLGAIWFVDFVLAHKLLAIRDMVSIEVDEVLAKRAEFNRPYACVSVEHGDSSTVLATMDLADSPVLAWLDYDTGPDGPVLDDLSLLCAEARAGSVVIVTVNAEKKNLPSDADDGHEYGPLEERMRAWAGDAVPSRIPESGRTNAGYPELLASVLMEHLHRCVRREGRDTTLSVVPLFNIGYKDSCPMVTVGGAIVEPELRGRIDTLLKSQEGLHTADEFVRINVPPLTFKEKAALDQMLPKDCAPSPEEVHEAGFQLQPEQLENYYRFYRHYPNFGEIEL